MNIVVLTGGISTERDVSIASGTKIYRALKNSGHKAVLLDVYFGLEGSENYIENIFEHYDDNAVGAGRVNKSVPNIGKVKNTRKCGDNSFFGENVIRICKSADIVFLALHGENGENGKIQAAFDLLGVKYTGTGSLGSALAMNKTISKQLFIRNNIDTPKGLAINKENIKDFAYEQIKLPSVIKPCSGGSSIGVSIVDTLDELKASIKATFEYENDILVEDYIKGREFSVGVLGDIVLPVIEIIPKQGFYDYEHKYQTDVTEEICPAKVNNDIAEKMQQMALQVHKKLNLEVYSREDFILSENGDIYCLEANTLPGMTPTSLIPQEAGAVGISYEELCNRIVELSLEVKRAEL